MEEMSVNTNPGFDFDHADFMMSDTRFSRARISDFAERPFASVEEMNAERA